MYDLRGGLWHDHFQDGAHSAEFMAPSGELLETNPVVGKKAEYRQVPRYPGEGRWVLEKLLPPSCSKEDWEKQYRDKESGLCLLGPYPERGTYHCCYELTKGGKYRELTADLIEGYCRLIEASRQYTQLDIYLAERQKRERDEKDWENYFDAVWDDAMPVGGVNRLFQAVSGPVNKRTKPEDVNLKHVDELPLPKHVTKRPGFYQV